MDPELLQDLISESTISLVGPSNESSCCPNNYSTTPSEKLVSGALLDTTTTSADKDDKISFMENTIVNYKGTIEEEYSNPIPIILLNFFLCSFLMIFIGIAVYPAVKKYCDTTFFSSSDSTVLETMNWIEDTDEAPESNSLPNLYERERTSISVPESEPTFIILSSTPVTGASSNEPLLPDSCTFELIEEIRS